MYLKLSLRSALRDRRDYQLYTLTLTVLTGVMTLAQMAAALGDRAGLETASLPLLVGLILVILRQRAQEFALYLLMGMERRHLAWMFFLEFFLLGCLCLAGGIVLGAGMGCCLLSLSPERGPLLPAIGSAAAETAGYFLAVQLVSLVSTAQLIRRLEIRELTAERASDRSWNLGPGRVWAAAAGVSFAVLAAALLGIAFAPGAADMLVGLVSLPALALVFCFYRALYALLSGYRRRGGRLLLRGDRLFLASQLLSGGAQSALLDSVLCLCLLLAAAAFLCGHALPGLGRHGPGPCTLDGLPPGGHLRHLPGDLLCRPLSAPGGGRPARPAERPDPPPAGQKRPGYPRPAGPADLPALCPAPAAVPAPAGPGRPSGGIPAVDPPAGGGPLRRVPPVLRGSLGPLRLDGVPPERADGRGLTC